MVLMCSRAHESEEALAEHGLARSNAPTRVLVGGLGLGFTLRAVLDRVSAETKVSVAELVPQLVEWNREHVGGLAGHPLKDSRSEVIVGDVLDVMKRSTAAFDVILLDVDNGPVALSNASNQRLYSRRGVGTCHEALRPGGVLAVWSASPSARFERIMSGAGFEVEVLRVPAFKTGRASHVLFLGAVPR
jgi:spermidine synthase